MTGPRYGTRPVTIADPPSPAPNLPRPGTGHLRAAFIGAPIWLDLCAPPGRSPGFEAWRVPGAAGDWSWSLLDQLRPHVSVVFDPLEVPVQALRRLPGLSLGVLVGGAEGGRAGEVIGAMDRVLGLRPGLSGTAFGAGRVWRGVPPPVSDALFAPVRELHGRPRVMALGRSTPHREKMLMPAKHHHDLLQVLHGVSGELLAGLLRDYDAGVYVAREPGGGFGAQAALHLAAGQLLIAETLAPAHGLERNLDYLHFESPGELVWVLDRLARFPEMYQRLRIRGRLKAEQYRASRLFARLLHDLRADVAAFGSPRRPG